MKHDPKNPCSCEDCQMLDIMFGDPTLSTWEKKFVDSVARQGNERDYSPKQKAVIKQVFDRQKRHWSTK